MKAHWRLIFALVCLTHFARADDLAESLKKLPTDILPKDFQAGEMLERDVSARLKAANQASTEAWRKIKTREDWERFRDEKIAKLKASLGEFPEPSPLNLKVVGDFREDGYTIQKIVYESRPKFYVTANLYVPAKLPTSAPGILLSHSHHSPKSQGELQDMGALWSRAGCYVLVPDHLGHGERRQHPFVTDKDYPEKFQVGRQDYHFRFNTAMQLYVAGDSLMGWMAWDLMRGVDVLLAQKNIDPKRIALMGGVAGGGDPAGVTAAIDPRITLVVPMNFGGPQPETRYPLPDNAEETFDYAGGGSWESTRNLAHSAKDGFLPWVIVGSVAPRGLIHGHEFSWDREHDPVWKRYEKIYSFYDASDKLDYTHGYGVLRESEDVASHCGNIGKPHRVRINEYLAKHWDVKADESQAIKRHTSAELACLPDSGVTMTPLHQIVGERIDERSAKFVKQIRETADSKDLFREAWAKRLGNIEVHPEARLEKLETLKQPGFIVERIVLEVEPGIRVPVIVLKKSEKAHSKMNLVVCTAGKKKCLKQYAANIESFLGDGESICLADLRGTGETAPGNDRGRRSATTSYAATELMLGETSVGRQLRDLRSVIRYIRQRDDVTGIRLGALSCSKTNAADLNVSRPLELDQPALADPNASLLVHLLLLFEPCTREHIETHGALSSYRSLCDRQFIHVPFDAIVPGAAKIGDLPFLAEQVRFEHRLEMRQVVDGRNQSVKADEFRKLYPGITLLDEKND